MGLLDKLFNKKKEEEVVTEQPRKTYAELQKEQQQQFEAKQKEYEKTLNVPEFDASQFADIELLEYFDVFDKQITKTLKAWTQTDGILLSKYVDVLLDKLGELSISQKAKIQKQINMIGNNNDSMRDMCKSVTYVSQNFEGFVIQQAKNIQRFFSEIVVALS